MWWAANFSELVVKIPAESPNGVSLATRIVNSVVLTPERHFCGLPERVDWGDLRVGHLDTGHAQRYVVRLVREGLARSWRDCYTYALPQRGTALLV